MSSPATNSAGYQALKSGCHPKVEGFHTNYGYIPSLAAGIVFLILFSLSGSAHTIQCWLRREWFCIVFILGCLAETIGWAGRIWNSQCPYNNMAFQIQICCLILAPSFFSAGVYFILGKVIKIVGPQFSLISANMYLYIFCTCDIISLVVQAAGGGMASAANNKIGGDTGPGTHVMVAGILFQIATMSVFCGLFALFLWRARHVDKAMLRMIHPSVFAMTLSVILLYIRGIYRTIELLQGWAGYLITHQRFFIALDGSMMILAVAIFNFIHPSWSLKKADGIHKNKPHESDGSEHHASIEMAEEGVRS